MGSCRSVAFVAALLGLAVLVLGPSARAQAATKPHTLFAAGDLMVARWVHYSISDRGPDWPLQDIHRSIAGADVAMVNLECVIATTGDFFYKGERRPYAYRARPETLDVVVRAGFDLVTTANNHSMDYGPAALLEQLELLEAAGIAQAGSGRTRDEAFSPTYLKVGGMMLAFVAVEDLTPLFGATASRAGIAHAWGPRLYGPLRRALAEARQHADLVILSPHWGKNWTENPTSSRVTQAHDLIDMGYDAILGHSSHHVHGIEIYEGRPILYDMGSLLFDGVTQGRMRFGAGFVLEFDRRGFRKIVVHPVRLRRNRTVRANPKEVERIHAKLIELSQKLDPQIEFERAGDTLVVGIHRAKPPAPRKADPETFTVPGSARRVPDGWRGRTDPKVVLDAPPEWTRTTEPIDVGRGVAVLGFRGSEAARPGRAFVHEVVLRVPGPLKGRWFSRIVGKRRHGGGSFRLGHPFADGAFIPDLWRAGQVVVDRTLVRPPKVAEGIYDLYWGLQDRHDNRLPESGGPKESPDNLVKVGSIVITNKVPGGPAGVKWDGKLTPEMRRVLGLAQPPKQAQPRATRWTSAIVGLGVLAALAGAIAVGLRQRSRARDRS